MLLTSCCKAKVTQQFVVSTIPKNKQEKTKKKLLVTKSPITVQMRANCSLQSSLTIPDTFWSNVLLRISLLKRGSTLFWSQLSKFSILCFFNFCSVLCSSSVLLMSVGLMAHAPSQCWRQHCLPCF